MAKAGELKFVITVDEKGGIKSVRSFKEEVDKTTKTTKKGSAAIDRYSKKLKRGLKVATLAAAAGFAVAIKKTIDFNKEIALTATMMPGMTEEVDRLKSNVQDLAIQYGKSTIDLAKGAFLVVSAFGAQAASSAKLEMTAKAAAAGNAETAASLSLLSAVTKGYGVVTDEAFQKASDLAFQTVKFGQTDFPALAASMGKVIPVAAAMGVKQEELFTGFATLTGVTGNAAEVSTQLSGILRAMIKPTEGMKQAIKDLGFETAEQMIEQEGLVGSMRMLVANTDGTSESIGKLFRRAEALTAVFALTGGQAEVFNQKFEELKDSAGATDEAFREISDGVNKAGFSLEQAKQSFVVFTQKIADSTLQSDDFNDALQGMKRSFESKEFIAAIAAITSTIAKFVAGLVEGIAAFAEWLQQAADTQARFSSQAMQWGESFDTIYAALRQAGLSFEEYNKITSEMASSNVINELRDQQSELSETIDKTNKIMKESDPLSIAYGEAQFANAAATKELNEITADRNDLLLNQLFEIMKNTGATKVNSEIIEKAREILRKNALGIKDATDETNKNTDSLNKNAAEMTEVEKIANQYGVSLNSALAILQTQKPELAKITKLQNDLGVSLEEATKVYGILNQLEEDRKNTIKETNEELPKLIITNNDLDQALSDLVAEMDEVERKQGELNEGFLKEAEAIADVSEATEGYINELSFLEKAYRSIKESGETFGNVLQGLGRLSFIPDQMAKSFMGLGDTIARAASGDILGALSSGVSFLTGLFGKDGLTGQIEFATEALRKFGITGKEEIEAVAKAMEDFADSFSMKDILADPEAYFDGLKAAGEEAAEEIAKSTSQWFEPIRDTIPDLEKFLAVPAKNAEEFNAQTTITLGTFANMLKSGLSITEALTQMDGVFDKLIASQEALGIEGDKTFEALKEFRGLVKGNQELVDSVEGLNAVMEATAALGELSQNQIDAFGTSAKSKFDDLIDAGFSQNQALTLIGPTLLQLKENAEKYGLELDANTQKMIEQAEASGVFDEMADPMDKLVDILEKIFVQLGGNMDELTDFGEAGEAAASKASDAQGELQSSIEGTGMVAADASKTMADSMEHAIDSVSRDMINLEDVTADVMTTMSEDANAAATDMQNSFVDASKNSLDAIRGLAAGAKNSLSGLGGAGAASQPPLLQQRRGIPGFSTGGSGIVPPGFNNDNYLVGLSSGEPFSVGSTSNSTTNNNTDNMNITLKQEITKEDSVDSIALKTIAALKEKRFGLDKEIKNAIGVS